MPKPDKPTVPPAALRTDPDTFAERAENTIIFFETLTDFMDETNDWVDEKAIEATTAAMGGDLSPLTGMAGRVVAVNQTENGLVPLLLDALIDEIGASDTLKWGGGEHRLTNNDGNGNAALRFGHSAEGSEATTQANGAGVAIKANIDNTSTGSLTVELYDSGVNVGDPISMIASAVFDYTLEDDLPSDRSVVSRVRGDLRYALKADGIVPGNITWVDVSGSRGNDTAYQNTYDGILFVYARGGPTGECTCQISDAPGGPWRTAVHLSRTEGNHMIFPVPAGQYYQFTGSAFVQAVRELR